MGLKLNTSNESKLNEFRRFGLSNLERTSLDLEEPDSTKETVIRYKATKCGEGVLVEDTSLDIEGESVGVNIKWIQENLDDFVGKAATFHVMMGIYRNGVVELFHGITKGTIGWKKGSGMGFDPYFYPDGSTLSFGESKPDSANPRWKAVQAFLSGNPSYKTEPLFSWEGPWQG